MSTTVTYKNQIVTTVNNTTKELTTRGKYLEDNIHLTDVSGAGGNMQAKTNINPTMASQTITPDSGYDGLSSVQINAMPAGTAGTPTATKGTVSNHSVNVTPSVTNTTGYITGSTKTGTAVTVTAAELVSGTKSITANGTGQDVTNYATVDVNVPTSVNLQAKTNISPSTASRIITPDSGYDGLSSVQINGMPIGTQGTPTATKGIVSNHSVNVTPSVVNQAGYITGGTQTGSAVTVTAAELVSGDKAITQNGNNIDVTDYETVSVNVSGSGVDINSIADGTIPTGTMALATATSITSYAFASRTAITNVTAPACLTIGEYAFYKCTGLESITIDALTNFSGDYAFSDCTKLTSIALPALSNTTRARTFNNCSKLTVVDLGNCTRVQNQFANGATLLRTLILRKSDSIATLDAWNAVTLAGIYNNPTSSTIYVPQALISTYQASSNWQTGYQAGLTFAKIEGSIYE